MFRIALASLAALFIAACARETPEKLDLSQPPKKDAAQKLAEGEPVAPEDIMPRDEGK